jgi:uncharacterized membrane protein
MPVQASSSRWIVRIPEAESSVTRDALRLAAGAVFLAGALLLVGDRSLSFDELFAAHAASLPVRDLLRLVSEHDAHPPLYYLLLKAWTAMFGSAEVNLRALSALIGLGLLWATQRLAASVRPAAGPWAGAALLAAPLFLYASVEATRYTLLTFLYAWAALETLHIVRDPGRPPWLLAGLFAALTYTHYLGLVFCAALGFFTLGQGRGVLRRVLPSAGVAALLFLPWVLVLWHHLVDGRINPPWRGPLPATWPLHVLHLVGFGGRAFGAASMYLHPSAPVGVQFLLGLPVLAVGLLSAESVYRADRRLASLLAGCAGVPTAVLFGVSAWTGSLVAYPRYFVFLLPFWAVAVGIAASEARTWPRRRQVLGALSIAALLLLSPASLTDFATHPTAGSGDRKGMVAYLRDRVLSGDAVWIYPDWERLALSYYAPGLPGRIFLLGGWGKALDPVAAAREADRIGAAHRRVWIVERPPMPPGIFDATYRRLARTHRVRDFREFDGIRVTLLVKRSRR